MEVVEAACGADRTVSRTSILLMRKANNRRWRQRSKPSLKSRDLRRCIMMKIIRDSKLIWRNMIWPDFCLVWSPDTRCEIENGVREVPNPLFELHTDRYIQSSSILTFSVRIRSKMAGTDLFFQRAIGRWSKPWSKFMPEALILRIIGDNARRKWISCEEKVSIISGDLV